MLVTYSGHGPSTTSPATGCTHASGRGSRAAPFGRVRKTYLMVLTVAARVSDDPRPQPWSGAALTSMSARSSSTSGASRLPPFSARSSSANLMVALASSSSENASAWR